MPASLSGIAIALTGASSFASRPLLFALLRRQPSQLVLCDSLDGLAELQLQLLPWCEQQVIITDLHWWSQESPAALPALHGIQWLIHGDSVRSETLLQANSCAAVRRNIQSTQQFLDALPEPGVPLVVLSSHLAAQRQGVAGSSLAATEALVAQWAACHPSCPVQVWRLPAVFDPQATSADTASSPAESWLRERLAQAFIDQLLSSASAQACQQLLAAEPELSLDRPMLRGEPLAEAVERPAQPIQTWLASLAEPLARYDNPVVREALEGLWT